jgi:hypothetical protein
MWRAAPPPSSSMPAMPLPRLKICSMLALALLVGGCGSSHSTSTTTISSAPTTGPSLGVSSAPTGATGGTQTSPKPNTTKQEPKKALEFNEGAGEPEKMKAREKVTGVPVKRQYPTSLQESFVTTCTAAGGSHSACECVIKKLELSQKEKGYSLAELLATDVGLRRASYQAIAKGGPVQVPGPAFQAMRTCK